MFEDPNFYIILSFFPLVGIGLLRYKKVLLYFLNKKIHAVEAVMNQASAEKEKALLDLTHANQAVANLPEEIAKIWEKHSVNLQQMHEVLNQESAQQEQLNKVRLDQIQSQLLQNEYSLFVDKMCEQFRDDILHSSKADYQKILGQSIELLDHVDRSAF